VQDPRDSRMLYEVLREKVVPLYYDIDSQGLPTKWLDRIKRALRIMGCAFNSDRMVMTMF